MRDFKPHYLTVNGLRFHHLEWDGDDPPVVFLPGFISNALAALRLAAAVSPARRVLAFDLRGRGGSDKPAGGYGLEQHLEDIRARLASLGIEQVILAGHSFGAVLSLFFADRYTDLVEKLILFDGGAAPAPEAFQLFTAYHRNLVYNYPSVEGYMARYRDLSTLQPWTEEAELLTRANVIEQADGTAARSVPRHVVEAELDRLSLDDWEKLSEIYPRLKMPCLLVRAGLGSFGKDDRHLPDEVLHKMILPDLCVYDMPMAGHTAVLTIPNPERDALLVDFVKK